MGWRKQAAHKLVALEDVRRLTGLDPEKVLLKPDTQHVVCINKGGRRSEFVRIPLQFLLAEAEQD
jgi:hypothetical protein